LKICKDGRIWGQNNKEAGTHLGILFRDTSKQTNKWIKKLTDEENRARWGNYGINTRFKKGQISLMKGKKHTKESIEKARKSHKENNARGENHYRWKGGISKLITNIRTTFEYRQWRSDVFTRDNYICRECGYENGNKLQAHHIKSISYLIQKYEITTLEQAIKCEELFNINNGLTLCLDCHKLTDNYCRKERRE
jgi:5-methylcytosine-specific restriction endonuclease McrA